MQGEAKKVLIARHEDLNIIMSLLDSLPVDEAVIIKSSIIMMIYNMVEGTFTALLQEVFDFLAENHSDLESISMKLKNTFLKYHSKCIGNDRNKLDEFRKKKSIEIPEFCDYVKHVKLYSGNLDAKEIRKVSESFGIKVVCVKKYESLLFVKNSRNELAHGETRYLDACRDKTKSEIEFYKEEAYNFMNKVIVAFEKVYG